MENNNNKITTVKISKELHSKLLDLYRKHGSRTLQDFINEGLEAWITFIQADLKEKNEYLHSNI